MEIASKREGFDTRFEKRSNHRRCGTAEVYVFSIKTKQIFPYSEQHTVVLNERMSSAPHKPRLQDRDLRSVRDDLTKIGR
jgi:hypothetical protein